METGLKVWRDLTAACLYGFGHYPYSAGWWEAVINKGDRERLFLLKTLPGLFHESPAIRESVIILHKMDTADVPVLTAGGVEWQMNKQTGWGEPPKSPFLGA